MLQECGALLHLLFPGSLLHCPSGMPGLKAGAGFFGSPHMGALLCSSRSTWHRVTAGCAPQVLQSKEDLIEGIKNVLKERDEAYLRLLQGQSEETDSLIALMAEEHDKFKRGQEQVLEAVEAAYLQVRAGVSATAAL
jgi:hypothetical protein